ncbi:hypothetical protein M8C21_002314, partial [Ambrosia artemisiifolia]
PDIKNSSFFFVSGIESFTTNVSVHATSTPFIKAASATVATSLYKPFLDPSPFPFTQNHFLELCICPTPTIIITTITNSKTQYFELCSRFNPSIHYMATKSINHGYFNGCTVIA